MFTVLCSLSLSRLCLKRSNPKEPSLGMLLGAWVCVHWTFIVILWCNIPLNSWMDGSPVYATRNQGPHLRRTRLRVLRLDRPARKIPAQERHLAFPSLRVVPKEPQTFGTAVWNQGFSFIVMVRPWGVLYMLSDALSIDCCNNPLCTSLMPLYS